MKIRTDFVTNSSSSSFSLIITVETANGRVTFEETPRDFDINDESKVYFEADLSTVLDGRTNPKKIRKKYSSVEALAKFLMASVTDDLNHWLSGYLKYDDDEIYNADLKNREKISARKDEFIKELTEKAPEISDISKIVVCRYYNAWGEFADLIIENDWTLREFAEKVLATTGEEQKAVLREMHKYITSSSDERCGETFAVGFDDIRYRFWYGAKDDGNYRALISLSERLCSGKVLLPNSEGYEYQVLDLAKGEYSKYAEFDT